MDEIIKKESGRLMPLEDVANVLGYNEECLRKKCTELGFTRNGVKTELTEPQVLKLKSVLVPRTSDMKVRAENSLTKLEMLQNVQRDLQCLVNENHQLESERLGIHTKDCRSGRMRNYGVPYKGSKNKIAEWVVSNLPEAANFYDLFAGGCAVTHCALLSGKYQSCYANDLWTAPRLFLDAVNGKYRDEKRWISREQFFAERLTDPYIQFCWSFGNDGRGYMYSKEIEPYKKACHYAIVFDDWTQLNSLCPEVAESANKALENAADIRERRMKFGPAVVKRLKEIGDVSVFGRNPLYSSCHTKKPNKTRPVKMQSLERLQSLESLERLERLEVTQGDYRNVRIKPNSVIYCDIPYRNTRGYNFKLGKKSDKNDFDYEAFYKWCGKQKELVIVSEYAMPEDFVCVGSREKTVSLSAVSTGKAVERLFVPKHQIKLYNSMMEKDKATCVQPYLFPELYTGRYA